MKRVVLIFLVSVLSSCSVKLVTPTQADVSRVSGKYSGYTLADLNAGKALFEQRCTQCHGLKNPVKRTPDKWAQLVPQMAYRSEGKQGVTKIDSKEQDLILKYLVTMSGAPKQGK